MLSTTRNLTVRDLLQFHERDVARWVESCSEEEFVRVCDVADFLSLHGPVTSSGASMMLAKCVALAAVYIHNGAPRALARAKRDPKAVVPPIDSSSPSTDLQLARSWPPYFAVGDDAIDFWAEHPERVRARKAAFAAEHAGGAS